MRFGVRIPTTKKKKDFNFLNNRNLLAFFIKERNKWGKMMKIPQPDMRKRQSFAVCVQ